MAMASNRGIKILLAFLFFIAFVNLINNYIYCIYKYSAEKPRPFRSFEEEIKEMSNAIKKKQNDKSEIKPCPEPPPDLGPLEYNPWQNTSHLNTGDPYSVFLYGGRNKLVTCLPNEKAAIIVPIESSRTIPSAFISHMHIFLRKQLIESQLFLVQQSEGTFDPGQLFIAAVSEINRIREYRHEYQCFILHEATFVPVDTRNLYRCGPVPRQLVAAIWEDHYNITSYEPMVGGAIAFSYAQIMKMDELTDKMNDSWDFGTMAERLMTANYSIEKSSPDFGVYVLDKTTFQPEIVTELTQHTTLSPEESVEPVLHYSVISYQTQIDYTYFEIHLPDISQESLTDSQTVPVGPTVNA